MPRIDTSKISKDSLSAMESYQVYNGLDCCVTYEVFEVLSEQLRKKNDESASVVYSFERSCQALALSMMMRGFAVDSYEREKFTKNLISTQSRCQYLLDGFATAIWGRGLNPRSPKQNMEFFYGAMSLPEQFVSDKGVRRVSCNRECLEKLQAYFHTVPIINCIFEIRDISKKLSVLQSKIGADGRFRSSFSPAATESGRWSSSKDAFGEGGNLQNITSELRRVFVADPGKKLLHFDQEQAESRVVGLLLKELCNEPKYLEYCESGDLHTSVAMDLWPGKVVDRQTAETLCYRHFSHRDISKRGGHAANYMVTPITLSKRLGLPYKLCEEFINSYYKKFGHKKWHTYVARELQLHQSLTTPLGFTREFFGNPYDDATLREAIAFVPQSTVGQLTALIAMRASKKLCLLEPLTNDHDGFTWQFKDEPGVESNLISELREIARVPIALGRSTLVIPIEISSGWNWAPYNKDTNPEGLMKYRGEDARRRAFGAKRLI